MGAFSDGFESGDFSKWGFHDPTLLIQTDVVHTGRYALKASFAGSYTGHRADVMNILLNPCYFRIYLLMNVLPNINEAFIFQSWETSVFSEYLVPSVQRNGAGTLQLNIWGPSGIGPYVANYPFQANYWHCIEVAMFFNVAGWVKGWVEGNLLINQNLNTSAYNAFDLAVGNETYSMVGPLNAYTDDVVISDAYIGPIPSPPTPNVEPKIMNRGSCNGWTRHTSPQTVATMVRWSSKGCIRHSSAPRT
jgi:hypothetical protein